MSDIDARLGHAAYLAKSGQVLQAELLFQDIVKESPGNVPASRALAQLALFRGDAVRAVELLHELVRTHPNDAQLVLDFAPALVAAGQLIDVVLMLESAAERHPKHHSIWLLLGQARQAAGDDAGALQAWYEAVVGAQCEGRWKDESTTPRHLLEPVIHAIERVRVGRRELLFGAYEDLRKCYGANELKRVDRALRGYLREWSSTPTDKRQRPKFFFFPDLPNGPYHDPFLHPWAGKLSSSFAAIREDALRVLAEDQHFQDFLRLSPHAKVEDYLRGEGVVLAWEAFFFYCCGERFDVNHARCPWTSEILKSIDLCRIADQAPEICFSVLQSGSHILPHYGVSNVRLVMHLPLLVPPDCALNLIDVGEHHWQEGQLVMFDDTFQHEAWNRSGQTRIVLLMDCWNPHLTPVERVAVKQLIEMISRFQLADRAAKASVPLR